MIFEKHIPPKLPKKEQQKNVQTQKSPRHVVPIGSMYGKLHQRLIFIVHVGS